MDPRTTTAGRARSHRRPPVRGRRPAVYLCVAAAGAVLVNVLVGTGPAAEAGTSESVSVAQQLGLTADSGPVDVTRELQPLEDLAASRSSRQAAETAAKRAQSAADRAVAARRKAAAQAAVRAAAAAAAAKKAAAVAEKQTGVTAAASIAATVIAHITNSAGAVMPQTQAAANAVVSNVPGAAGITLGGTRSSATDPNGHPSGKALDYMVLSDGALGDAIVAYHVAHWNELGVEYLIYRQRMLSSPGGAWTAMEDRGSPTANHMDHVHVNYR